MKKNKEKFKQFVIEQLKDYDEWREASPDGYAEIITDEAVKLFCQPAVIESAFIELFDKAACIQHWHNTGKNDDGMVVSSEKVYELWEVLDKYRDLRHSL